MTDRELADAATAALKKTTITYQEWERRKAAGKYADVTKTEWWKAFDALGKIDATPPPPPGQREVITPVQFDTFIGKGRRAFTDVEITGAVRVGVPEVQFENAVAASSIDVLPAADRFLWEGGSGKGFYLYGAQGVVVSGVDLDGENTNDGCKLWGQSGKLPDYIIENCTLHDFWNPSAGSHTQALFLGSCRKSVVRGCRFRNNGNTAHVFLSTFGATSGGPGRYELSGNDFGDTHGAYFSVNVHPDEIPYRPETPVYIEPGQPTVKALCSDPRWVRAAA